MVRRIATVLVVLSCSSVVGAPAIPEHNDEASIRKVISDYGHAIETKDLALFKTVKPNLSKDEERRVKAAFESIVSQEVKITIQSIEIEKDQAKVRLFRRDKINGSLISTFPQTLTMAKGPQGWSIREIGR